MIGAEVETLLGAIDVRVQVERPDQPFGAAAGDAENDEIELFGHFPRNFGRCLGPMIENFAEDRKRRLAAGQK